MMTLLFPLIGLVGLLALVAVGSFLVIETRRKYMHLWLGAYLRQRFSKQPSVEGTRHIIFCFVDHFEPMLGKADYETECWRVQQWQQRYPKLAAKHRDADGKPPQHSFFYPEEEYRKEHLDIVEDLCRQGLGEIEIHLHHDGDTAEGLTEKLTRFTQTLHQNHGALPINPDNGRPNYAFIHGNWCLDNSRPDGRWCGVNNELQVLSQTGCYADFTLPAAPDPSQTRKINSIYYAIDDPEQPKSHDEGLDVVAGQPGTGDMLLIQGPLMVAWHDRRWGLFPRTENADVRNNQPPEPRRVDNWIKANIHVKGRPEWVFVKIHTHGASEGCMEACLGEPAEVMHNYLETAYNDGKRYALHYVSAREMFNIVKAAEAGKEGNPNSYRDFVLPKPEGVPQ